MPRPVYILCSQSGATDGQTGLISHFNVIEKVIIAPLPDKDAPRADQRTGPTVMRITAVWARLEGESELECEYQTVFHFPGREEEDVLGEGRFHFSHPFHRIIADVRVLGFYAPGTLRVENRLRPVGNTDWLRQDYPILLGFEQESTSDRDPA